MAAMVFAFVPPVGGPSLNGMLAGSGPVPNFYVLPPKSTLTDDLRYVKSRLVVELLIASESLNTHRVTLHKSPFTLNFLSKRDALGKRRKW